MARKGVVAALVGMALLVSAVVSAVATTTGGGAAATHPTRLGPDEELSYLGQGSNESGEAGRSAAHEDYAEPRVPERHDRLRSDAWRDRGGQQGEGQGLEAER